MDYVAIITKIIIPIIGAIMIYIVYPYIRTLTSKEQREEIMAWVRIGVASAEQMEKAGLIKVPKKEHVLQFLADKGFDITMEDLENILEALVWELNEEKRKKVDVIIE